ncbi:Protein CBG25680 [Caenorhabditis briggsae]
MVEEQ